MHQLKVPAPLAGAGVQRDDRRAEEVRANAVGPVEIVGRRSEADVRDAAARVDGRFSPVVDAADVLPRVLRPRVVPEFARTRHRVKRPDQFPRADVVGADVARRRHVAFAGRAAENDQVLEHAAGRIRLNGADRLGIAAIDPDAQVDDAVGAEGHDRLAGFRVHLLEQAVHREDEPLVAAVRALPVIEAAGGHAVHVLADPDLLPGLRVDGDERSVPPAPVDHAAGDVGHKSGVAVRIRPRHLQLGDV